MKKILIVGATSGMAEACARLWAQRGDQLFLAARNEAQLESVATDLRVKGAAKVVTRVFDVQDYEQHPSLARECLEALGGIDVVLVAHGTLTDQERAQKDVGYALQEVSVNGVSVLSLLTALAPVLEAQGHGTLAVISSVAGDRGRQSNYVYGSAKAMVTAFLSGLRQRLAKQGVNVLTIKPGFVSTPMTAHLPQGPLWGKPEAVARDISRAIDRGRGQIYTPGFWRLIMFIITHIPEFVFVKLKL